MKMEDIKFFLVRLGFRVADCVIEHLAGFAVLVALLVPLALLLLWARGHLDARPPVIREAVPAAVGNESVKIAEIKKPRRKASVPVAVVSETV